MSGAGSGITILMMLALPWGKEPQSGATISALAKFCARVKC